MPQNPWNTHDFKVKMLDWSAVRGSRLSYTCRRCGRGFCNFTVAGNDTWAIDSDGHSLEHAVSARWLSEACPRALSENDNKDRKRLRAPSEQ